METAQVYDLEVASKVYLDQIEKSKGQQVRDFLERHLRGFTVKNLALIDSDSDLNLFSLRTQSDESAFKAVVNIRRINDIKYVNKFFESANASLAQGGLFLGCVKTSSNRKRRILEKYIFPLNYLRYFFHFVFKRVIPKLPLFKKVYFFLTKGRDRSISEMEAYGRLYSCGFELVESVEIGNLLWFVSTKVKEPEFNTHATYGPVIRLKRIGKGGELFNVYKLRTMHPYSEYLQSYINSKYGLQSGGKFNNDPRVTTIGKIFRKFWLDELPMIVNLLRGELKLVGVRPLSRHYFSLYPESVQSDRIKTKPGLLPPFYADLPETFEEIIESERRYLKSYQTYGRLTDVKYFCVIFYNIVFRRARSN